MRYVPLPKTSGQGGIRKIMSKRFKTLLGGGLVLLLSLVAINHAGAQTCVQPPPGLVSWWPGDGNADDIQNGNDGTVLGGTFFTPAKVGEGFTFDSDDDRVTIPHNANLNVNSPGFTAELWMKGIKNQPQSLYLVVGKSHGFVDNTGWVFQGVSATGELFFGIGAGGGFPGVSSVVDVLDGNFHHIAGTWDGSLIQLYVDGVPQGSVPLTTPANNTRAVNIGFAWGGGSPQRFFRGIVDELEIFNRALSAKEIAAIYNAGSAGKCKAITVQIDVKPGSEPNCFNIDGHGVIPVAILGSADDINTATLSFGGLAVRVRAERGPQCSIEDSNGDQFLDLVCHFEDNPDNWVAGGDTASLTGELLDGTPIEGTDSICIVP
jgi:hypothetical protein